MTPSVNAADAARAVLDATARFEDIAVALLACPDAPVRRMIIRTPDDTEGSLGAADTRALEIAATLLQSPTASKPVAETVVIDGRECTLYVEAHRAPEQLIVVGAGHIAVPLAHLGAMLDFRVTVLDDREEFATAERFDDRVRVVRADFENDPFRDVRIDERTYIALVTRGHRWDFDCLRRVLTLPVRPRYIGMIGSKRRVRAAFTALENGGFGKDVRGMIRAPIGLEIGAETPEEIAVAIGAEIVAERRGFGTAGGLNGGDLNGGE